MKVDQTFIDFALSRARRGRVSALSPIPPRRCQVCGRADSRHGLVVTKPFNFKRMPAFSAT
jgi:hypothetical protein